MYCMKCGEEIPDDSKVCGYCGFRLPVQPAAAPPKEAQKPAPPKAVEKPPLAEDPKTPAPKKAAKPAKTKTPRQWKLPTWGWIAIGAGVLVVALVLVFTLGNTATKLVLNGECEGTFYATAGKPLELHYGHWGVMGREWIEANEAALTIYLYINGTPGVGRLAKPARTSELPCAERQDFSDEEWSDARWLHAVSTVTLSEGTHHVLIVVSLRDEISDGFDSDGDGYLDMYGPGEIIRNEYTIIAQD